MVKEKLLLLGDTVLQYLCCVCRHVSSMRRL